jgi:hypothetical protein
MTTKDHPGAKYLLVLVLELLEKKNFIVEHWQHFKSVEKESQGVC